MCQEFVWLIGPFDLGSARKDEPGSRRIGLLAAAQQDDRRCRRSVAKRPSHIGLHPIAMTIPLASVQMRIQDDQSRTNTLQTAYERSTVAHFMDGVTRFAQNKTRKFPAEEVVTCNYDLHGSSIFNQCVYLDKSDPSVTYFTMYLSLTLPQSLVYVQIYKRRANYDFLLDCAPNWTVCTIGCSAVFVWQMQAGSEVVV